MKTIPGLPGWLKIVRTSPSAYEREVLKSGGRFTSSQDVANLMRERLAGLLHEELHVISIDGSNQFLGMTKVSQGEVSDCRISIRTIFQVPCAIAASGIILVHNHPSCRVVASAEDIHMTQAVFDVSMLIGIPLVDHIIISPLQHSSMLDQSIGPFAS